MDVRRRGNAKGRIALQTLLATGLAIGRLAAVVAAAAGWLRWWRWCCCCCWQLTAAIKKSEPATLLLALGRLCFIKEVELKGEYGAQR